MNAIGRTTAWHETHQRLEVLRQNNQNEKIMQTELKHANEELKVLRHERLLQLYIEEQRQQEAELNEMGFAVFKDRL